MPGWPPHPRAGVLSGSRCGLGVSLGHRPHRPPTRKAYVLEGEVDGPVAGMALAFAVVVV